jgi:hypothetical protein
MATSCNLIMLIAEAKYDMHTSLLVSTLLHLPQEVPGRAQEQDIANPR